MTIKGSRDHIVAIDDDVWIGCLSHPVAWWLENGEKLAQENNYTPAQIAEYAEHLRHVERVLAMPREAQL